MPFLVIISRKDNEDVAVLLPHALFWFSSLLPGGLKILILNGSGLQIQTNGMTRTSAGSVFLATAIKIGHSKVLLELVMHRFEIFC
jgi:hypothetical protein